ncbi:MAG: GNAT family N-acetyltransferase [Longilinea sp.]|nr:GNAT family N-acetyltransferase [Longilinea sp.]
MPVEIREVSNLRDLRKFVLFPYQLYRNNPYWVPLLISDELNTLRRDRNPAFEYCEARYWLAYQQGKIVGRIAGILNRSHIQKWQQPYLRFSWFDFIDDPQVSKALLETVEAWAKELGLSAVHGPIGFTDLDREGMLVEGFEEMGTLSTFYNYPYYPQHMQQHGYTKDTDWVEYELSLPTEPNADIARLAEIVLRRNKLHVLQARSKKELLPYAPQIFDLLNKAYENLYGVVPLTQRQMQSYTKEYFSFIEPDLVPVILDENNKVVAFGITMPSLTRALQKARGHLWPFGFLHLMGALRKNDRADLYLVAIDPAYQGKGLNAVLMDQVQHAFIRRGFTKAESNPELETNTRVQAQWKHFDHRQHKRRRCFIKTL